MDNFQVDDIVVEEGMPNEVLPDNVVKIAVVGVGGGGSNMIDYMIDRGTHKIDLIASNTDKQALDKSKAPKKVQLGLELTKGLGAGMKPDVGKEAALESLEDIKDTLRGADIVFISAGLGGGTGTGAASVVAQAAKDVNALSVAVVTKPFSWEGKKRAGLANLGLEELRKVVDSIIIIHNDKLIDSIEDDLGFQDSFGVVNKVLFEAVNGISEVILNSGEMNTDFADIQTIMQHKGVALMGIGKAKGEDSAMDALREAVDSPLLDKMSLTGAKGIVLHVEMNPNIPMRTIHGTMTKLHETLNDNVEVIFGTTPNQNFDLDEIKITLIATGFEIENNKVESKPNSQKFDTTPITKPISDIQSSHSSSDVTTPPATPKMTIEEELLPQDDSLDTPPLMRGYNTKYKI
jgi:cell division protein FtsZ